MGVLLIVPFLLAAVVVARSARIVKPGEVGLVSRLGRHSRVLHPGLHIILPVVETVSTVRSNSKEKLIENVPIADKDGRSGTLSIRIVDKVINAEKAVYTVADFEAGVAAAASARLKAIVQNYSLSSLGVEMRKIEEELKASLAPVLEGWGMVLESISLEGLKS